MKKASAFEIVAARCWNLLNEGKPFTPIFVVGTYLLFHISNWGEWQFWSSSAIGLLMVLPLLAIYFIYDYPLMLRNYLWLAVVAFTLMGWQANVGLGLFAIGLFFFFTVLFWGTLYYHLRIGTSWLNFTRFWKLVLKNSDSTSGNAQEQLPKFLLLLWVWDQMAKLWGSGQMTRAEASKLFVLTVGILVLSWILHRYLFDWRPREEAAFTESPGAPLASPANKVYVLVIDGMRKDRFAEANTPFLDRLREAGTEYAQMETVYPARTVVCFSSMFTGTYPREHGITSNMVWSLGIKVESIFDALRKVGKKGRLLGIAHLIDSMGEDVESVTAVMHNDVADRNIIARAKLIMEQQNPDLLVVQLISTDQTGHSRGALYEEYKHKIEEADHLLEDFVSWLEVRGMMDGATVIVCADHGQADGIGGHGHLDEGERYVPFFMFGHGVERGKLVGDKQSLISVAPTIAYLLGAPFPDHSRGRVLSEAIIANQKGKERASDDEAASGRVFAGA